MRPGYFPRCSVYIRHPLDDTSDQLSLSSVNASTLVCVASLCPFIYLSSYVTVATTVINAARRGSRNTKKTKSNALQNARCLASITGCYNRAFIHATSGRGDRRWRQCGLRVRAALTMHKHKRTRCTAKSDVNTGSGGACRHNFGSTTGRGMHERPHSSVKYLRNIGITPDRQRRGSSTSPELL